MRFNESLLFNKFQLPIRRAIPVFIWLAFSITGNAQQKIAKPGKPIKTTHSTTVPTNTAASNSLEPPMVLVKGGQFIMGDNKREEFDEKPEHKVNISSFMMGKYEVTVAEFRKFMDSHTYVTDAEKQNFSYAFDGKSLIYNKPGVTWECDVLGNKRINEENHPVIHVSWNDAVAYCAWLSKQTGKAYRLPTEAEWEYAAKGGCLHESFTHSGSNDMEKVGWYAWNSGFVTHPVGKKKPNGLGIYDMSGNVWEWCADWYGPYSQYEQTNPTGPDTSTVGRVMRGGAWRFYVIKTRCTTRRHMVQDFNGSGPGFRVAVSL